MPIFLGKLGKRDPKLKILWIFSCSCIRIKYLIWRLLLNMFFSITMNLFPASERSAGNLLEDQNGSDEQI